MDDRARDGHQQRVSRSRWQQHSTNGDRDVRLGGQLFVGLRVEPGAVLCENSDSLCLSAVASGTQTLDLFIINYGASGYSVPGSATVTLNTTWQRFALTATNQAGLTSAYFQIGGGATLSGGQSVSVWGAQMVVGTSPDGYVETQNTTTVTGSSQTLAANGLNETYSYDGFGNGQSTGTYNFIQAYTTSNQLSGWSYDAAGNLLYDGLGNGYLYDGEGKIKSGAGVSYLYTPEGQRVEKSGSSLVDTVYFGGRPIARLTGGAWTDLIYDGTGLLAEVPGVQTGAPVYRMTDHLGSLVGTLSSTGAVVSTLDLGPFGEVLSGGSPDAYLFTGKERDSESGRLLRGKILQQQHGQVHVPRLE